MNKLVLITLAVLLVSLSVSADHLGHGYGLHGHGFSGHVDEHGYKVDIEHHGHGHHGHHGHGGSGHSSRYFHMQGHHGHHGGFH
ncbi:hypothetical protein JTE90_005067 [Oedothorax gibbosus]|uniref:Uncharacterized protein n=1 Tax=Oedothorax gibbosus TaxID=931172 RepID=A0AAV6VDP8_9ARAC|nr:hypothetical protein JTE90_005067 [Oedothorax gibbosus]